ncbi:MAG: hypothetical protein ACOX6G_01150 [Christensenellales bacterium]|jgi:hypothetical protein
MELKKKALGLLSILLVAVLLTGCGQASLKDKIVGAWDNKEFVDSMGLSELGVAAPKDTWVEFTKDGKMQIMADGKELKVYIEEALKAAGSEKETIDTLLSILPEFTYKVNGDKLTLTFGEESQEMQTKLEGDKLSITEGETTTVFVKRK